MSEELEIINEFLVLKNFSKLRSALEAVVELHKPETVIVDVCLLDGEKYPCLTIQKIMKELE